MAKRGRPKNLIIYQCNPEDIKKYLNGEIDFVEIATEKTCADCIEFKPLPRSLGMDNLRYHNLYPNNLGKEFEKYEFFRVVDITTQEIHELGRYIGRETLKHFLSITRFRVEVGR